MVSDFLKDLFGLEGQTAVVIGAAGELGGAMARGLARAGAHVVIADVAEGPCRQRAAEFAAAGLRAGYATVNVTQRESIRALLAEVLRQTGRADILVNSAGVNAATSFLDAGDADWDRVLSINLRGVFQACQVFGRHMADSGGGAIVNVGSVTSLLPLSRVFAYSASKAAVLNLSRNIAQDLAAKGVRVNVLCPGFFPAEQNRKILDERRVDNIMRHTPMQRYGQPEELVGALLLLVSRKAGSFITGAPLSVDGGFTAAWF